LLPVEIHPIQDALVLRARGSELLILADHVAELKKLKSAGDFSKYFLDEALVNRPARKLFEAWLRKDGSLWARIYKSVQTIESSNAGQSTSDEPAAVTESIRVAAKENPNKDSAKAEPSHGAKSTAKSTVHSDNKNDQKKADKKPTDSPTKTEKSTSTSSGKSAGKSAGKSVDKATDKTAVKAPAKSASKPADNKPAAKKAEKSASSSQAKAASKSPAKPAGKAAVKTPAKTATKKSSKK